MAKREFLTTVISMRGMYKYTCDAKDCFTVVMYSVSSVIHICIKGESVLQEQLSRLFGVAANENVTQSCWFVLRIRFSCMKLLVAGKR